MTESAPAAAAPLSESDDKLWASLAHFGGILSFLAPLLIWLILKDRGAKVNVEAKESLNFQITVSLAVRVCFVLMVVLIGALLLPLVGLAALVFTVIAGIKANQGEAYRYPITLRLIK